MAKCPSYRQNHSLSHHILQTNVQLRKIIEKFATGGTLEPAPSDRHSIAQSGAPALLIAAAFDEMFCKSCLFPVRQHDPMHAECKKVGVHEGNRLLQQREDAAVCSESQPRILGDRACESNKEKMKEKRATIRSLRAEVDRTADGTIDLVNKQRDVLIKKIEENYSADIEKLQRQSEEIRKKIKNFEVFTPDRSENLVMRIGKLKAAEVEMNEFQLPKLEPLDAELLECWRNILTMENFSFGELKPPRLTAEDLPVFSSASRQFFLHPVPAGFLFAEEFRQVAACDIRRSGFRNVR